MEFTVSGGVQRRKRPYDLVGADSPVAPRAGGYRTTKLGEPIAYEYASFLEIAPEDPMAESLGE